MSRPVPNEAPASDPGPLRLALIGEAPGADEEAMGRPFCGRSGWALNGWLASAGISRAQCFVGNVSQIRPEGNDFHRFAWHGGEVQEGIAALREDLARFRPHCVVALGNAALHLLRHGNVAPPKSKLRQLFQWRSHVGTWRGSLFLGASSFDGGEAATLRMAEGRCPPLSLSGAVTPATLSLSGQTPPTGALLQGALTPAAQRGATNGAPVTAPLAHLAGGSFLSASCASPLSLSGDGVMASVQPENSRPATVSHSFKALPNGSVMNALDVNAELQAGSQQAGMGFVFIPPYATGHIAPLSQCSVPVWKCLSTYHPAATFREPSFVFPLVSDLKRAVAEARDPALVLPPRSIQWGLSVDELEARCAAIRAARTPVGFDIEGGLAGLQCCSFATSPAEAFVIDLMGEVLERPRTMRAIASVLEDVAVPKVLWNAAYERAILHATASITLRGYEDGMLAWWERFSELPKGLDFVASILTREPYWAEGIGWDKKTGWPKVTGAPFFTYNGLDSCLTLEIWQTPLIRAVTESRTPVAFEIA